MPSGEARDAIEVLPRPVRRFLERNVPTRDPLPERVRLTQVVEIQMKSGRPLSFSARSAAVGGSGVSCR